MADTKHHRKVRAYWHKHPYQMVTVFATLGSLIFGVLMLSKIILVTLSSAWEGCKDESRNMKRHYMNMVNWQKGVFKEYKNGR